MTEAEIEYKALTLAGTELMKNHNFKKVILDGYINYVALETGKSFSGTDSEVDALKAVTHLQNYLNSFTEE